MPSPEPAAPPRPTYIDRPELSEIFADGLERLFYDGSSVRMEFYVVRADEAKGSAPPKRWAYTACRLVLSVRGAVEMLNKMNQMQTALTEQGVIAVKPSPAKDK